MKPAAATCSLLLTLLLVQTGSIVNSPQDGESGELCAVLKQLLRVKDEAMTKEMKTLLDALFKAFSRCNDLLIPTTTVTDLTGTPSAPVASPAPGPTRPEEKPMTTATDKPTSKTATSATGTSTLPPAASTTGPSTPPPAASTTGTSTLPPAASTTGTSTLPPAASTTGTSTLPPAASKIIPLDTKRGNQAPPKSAHPPEGTSPNDSRRKEDSQGSPKSDRKFLWIILGVLGAVMLLTILILKSKVLICTRIHTHADVAEYMEEKMYRKHDDIVLLGVTPGAEGEDDCYFFPKGNAGYEVISPQSTY